jgi:membrane protease YdiL (CAAX protease family)
MGILAYIWLLQPRANALARWTALGLLTAWPILSQRRRGESLRDVGFRTDNLWPAARAAACVTAAAALSVAALGLAAHSTPRWTAGHTRGLLLYPLWALLQQYALQAFAYRRFRESIGDPRAASLVAAVLFGLLHLPNAVLVVVTTAGALAWCRIYERHPNLIALAFSHAWLAVWLDAAWPATWTGHLRVGPAKGATEGPSLGVLEHPAERGLEALERGAPLVPTFEAPNDAGLHMRFEQLDGDRGDGLPECRDLNQDVVAALAFRQHPLDSAHLALDAAQPVLERALGFRVQVELRVPALGHGPLRSIPGRRGGFAPRVGRRGAQRCAPVSRPSRIRYGPSRCRAAACRAPSSIPRTRSVLASAGASAR